MKSIRNTRLSQPNKKMSTQLNTLHRVGQQHRRSVLLAIVYLTLFNGVVFSIVNLMRGNIDLALADFVMVLYSIFILFLIPRTRNFSAVSLLFVIPFFSTMLLALNTPNTSVTIFGWVLLIPILSHLLLGRVRGLLVSSVFMLLAALIYWKQFHHSAELMDPRAIANVVVLSFCVLACSYAYEISRERSDLQLLNAAHTDFLTGLTNRMGLNEFFIRESMRARRDKSPLSYLAVDLDFFKQVNDRYGHDIGDQTLSHVAHVMKERLRGTDLVARVGGEEFAVLLVNTNADDAEKVAHSLRETVQSEPLQLPDYDVHVSISVGIAELGTDGDGLEELMIAADRRLYQAKDYGRNQVVGLGASKTPIKAPDSDLSIGLGA